MSAVLSGSTGIHLHLLAERKRRHVHAEQERARSLNYMCRRPMNPRFWDGFEIAVVPMKNKKLLLKFIDSIRSQC